MNIKFFIKLVMLTLVSYGLIPAEKAEQIEKVINPTADRNNLYLRNVNGIIEIGGCDSGRIHVIAEKFMRSDDKEALAMAWDEISLAVEEVDDGYLIYTDIPCTKVDLFEKTVNYCKCENEPCEYRMDYRVRVPRDFDLNVSNAGPGDIEIKNTGGDIIVDQINGDVRMFHTMGLYDVSTVNGSINLIPKEVPADGSAFKTINGDISFSCAPDFKADFRFRGFHGDFYTDFGYQVNESVSPSAMVEKSEHLTSYTLDVTPVIQIGEGGPGINLETMNGNIYIKKNNHQQIKN